MGLRCSLLGHVYEESTTEREREEQGGEVVVVERELQLCSRCGAEKVLSENTEVRTLEADRARRERDGRAGVDEAAAEDAAGEHTVAEDAAGEHTVAEDASQAGEGAMQDAETYISEATQSSPEPEVAGDPDASDQSAPVESSTADAPAAAEDDAVILDDDPAQERDREQWPDEARQETLPEADEEADSEPSPWPEPEGEDEGFDAEAGRDEDDGSVEFGGGLTPDVEPGEADEEGYVEAPAEQSTEASSASADSFKETGNPPPSRQGGSQQAEVGDHGFTSAGPVNPPTGSTDGDDTVLVCPECGFERQAARASLRAGDICPECRRGYLAERR